MHFSGMVRVMLDDDPCRHSDGHFIIGKVLGCDGLTTDDGSPANSDGGDDSNNKSGKNPCDSCHFKVKNRDYLSFALNDHVR